EELRQRVARLSEQGRTPGLATESVGGDPASHSYVRGKHNDCARVGINSIRKEQPAGATQADVEAVLDELGADPACTGYPLPLPCTPRGIVELLRRYEVPLNGAQVAVVGRGITVGRSIGLLLTRRSENATVTLCHTGTRDLAAEVKRADIVVAAAGSPHLITPDMVKPGAAVLDVGVTRTEASLQGDVHPTSEERRVG